jgi:hypothetical protein
VLKPQLVGDESFSHTFTVIADLEDGTYVQVQLAISNVGAGDGNGACRILVVEPKRDAWTTAKKLDRDEWRWEAGPPETLVMGPCTATIGSSMVIDAKLDEGSARIVLDSPVVARHPPHSRFRSSEGFFELTILVPWTNLAAHICTPGQPKRSIRGHGYADQFRTTLMPADSARRWVRFRGLEQEHSVLVLGRFPPGDGAAEAWIWRQGTSAPQVLDRLSVSRIRLSAGRSSTSWEVRGSRQGEAFRLISHGQLFRYAPVEQFGMVGRLVKSVVGNPVTTTYRAVLEGLSGQVPLRGILEVSHANEP